jgi:pimeloyl-ACP methyl ester carboxylesterase
MTGSHAPRAAMFAGAESNRLRADVFGEHGPAVLLLHGGGQTRHAWRKTADQLARAGWVAYALDQRGHGDSDWVDSAAYAFTDFAADAAAVAGQLTARHGMPPVSIGASLGGIASLIAEGVARQEGRGAVFGALVLVDVTPRVDGDGVAKIRGFMGARAQEGFASIEEAAEAVAAYLPHRARPRSYDGLRKNLRFHPDGRWRWHWDPRFLDGTHATAAEVAQRESMLVEAARDLKMPVLLVRGGSSEVVGEEHLREFLNLVPHAQYADVAGARHMVAGDRNDHFAAAILEFLAWFKETDRAAAQGGAASASRALATDQAP